MMIFFLVLGSVLKKLNSRSHPLNDFTLCFANYSPLPPAALLEYYININIIVAAPTERSATMQKDP